MPAYECLYVAVVSVSPYHIHSYLLLARRHDTHDRLFVLTTEPTKSKLNSPRLYCDPLGLYCVFETVLTY